MIGGYCGKKEFPSEVMALSLDTFAVSAAKQQQSALPAAVEDAVGALPAR